MPFAWGRNEGRQEMVDADVYVVISDAVESCLTFVTLSSAPGRRSVSQSVSTL
jgi:hypothetical protein